MTRADASRYTFTAESMAPRRLRDYSIAWVDEV